MTIKHISFDVWNTLITANTDYSAARNKILSEYAAITEESATSIYKEVKYLIDKDAEAGYCGGTLDSWFKLGKALGVSSWNIKNMQRDCIEAFEKYPPKLNRELSDALCDLYLSYDISIKSNTNFIPGSIVSRCAGLNKVPFIFKHFSDDFLMCKPDTRFFKQTLCDQRTLNLFPGQVLHVGDSEVFDGKCVDIGFNFCKIDNPEHLLNKLKNGELINA